MFFKFDFLLQFFALYCNSLPVKHVVSRKHVMTLNLFFLQTFEQWTHAGWQEYSAVSCSDASGSAAGTSGMHLFCLLIIKPFICLFVFLLIKQQKGTTCLIFKEWFTFSKVNYCLKEWGVQFFLRKNNWWKKKRRSFSKNWGWMSAKCQQCWCFRTGLEKQEQWL